jgi:hypothetical protein
MMLTTMFHHPSGILHLQKKVIVFLRDGKEVTFSAGFVVRVFARVKGLNFRVKTVGLRSLLYRKRIVLLALMLLRDDLLVKSFLENVVLFKVFEKSRVSGGFREIRPSPGFFQKL